MLFGSFCTRAAPQHAANHGTGPWETTATWQDEVEQPSTDISDDTTRISLSFVSSDFSVATNAWQRCVCTVPVLLASQCGRAMCDRGSTYDGDASAIHPTVAQDADDPRDLLPFMAKGSTDMGSCQALRRASSRKQRGAWLSLELEVSHSQTMPPVHSVQSSESCPVTSSILLLGAGPIPSTVAEPLAI